MTSKPKEKPNTWTQGGQAKSSDAAATMAKLLAVSTDTADLAQAAKSNADAIPATTRLLTKPLPENCSDRYASGWAYADWYISKGVSLHAEAPSNWNEEKVNGFWDRLAAERNAMANTAL